MSTFLLSKFFSIQKTKKLDKSDLVIPLKGDKKYPYVTRTVNNNGIESYTGYIDDFHLNPGNSFSLGLLQMNFQWHAEPWYCGQFVRRIVPKYDFSRNVMLYFLSVLQKNSVLFDPQAIKRVDGIFNSLRVDLPVTSDGQLDVQYMEQYIKRVEAVYIKRVEAYLAALGYESLDDCELSSQDLKVLSGPDEWGKFRIDKLFDVSSSNSKINAKSLSVIYDRDVNNSYPYVVRSAVNNGVKGYIVSDCKLNSSKTISFAQDTAEVFYQDKPYFTGDKIKVLKPLHLVNEKDLLYLVTAIRRAFMLFQWGSNSYNEKIISSTVIKLPVTPDGKPDYDFMDQYITAIEKKKVLKLKQAMDHKLDLYREMSHQD